MNPFIGNESVLETLLGAVREGRPAGCYIIEGPDGTGKKTLARFIAASLCCEERNDRAEPCLRCRSCQNILNGRNVDVNELSPAEKGKRITVDQVREFLQKTYILPSEGDWRVFIIQNSEAMKKEAQNALLKSIEEPGKNTVFFLLTNDKTKLLPTVRSRSVILHTELLKEEALIAALKKNGIDEIKNREAILLSRGSVGKAIELLSDESAIQKSAKVTEYFKAIFEGAGFVRLCLILPPSKMTRGDFPLYLSLFKSALRDMLCRAESQDSRAEFFTDEKFLSDLTLILNKKNAVKLFCLCDEFLLANESNVNLFSSLSALHLAAKDLTSPE